MTQRVCGNWIDAFLEYAEFGEAPYHMYFWVAVSTIAGALQRKVWLDQISFQWYPNNYIVLVAPPGVVSKSTTADFGIRLLKEVQGIKFGPNVVTWQALVTACSQSETEFQWSNQTYKQCAITINSSELGNLIAPADREMMDILTHLWDCRDIDKLTKKDGGEVIRNSCPNIIGCTTPGWIRGSIPEYMIDGGLISRIIWVYADEKRQLVAYPGLASQRIDTRNRQLHLIQDLTTISRLSGEVGLTRGAVEWGEEWYRKHNTKIREDSRYGGYYSRLQTHLHKLAIVCSAARSDSLWIDVEDLERADKALNTIERDLPRIFDNVGKSETASHTDRLYEYIKRHSLGVTVEDAYLYVHNYFPKETDFKSVMQGLIRAGMVQTASVNGKVGLRVPQSETTG